MLAVGTAIRYVPERRSSATSEGGPLVPGPDDPGTPTRTRSDSRRNAQLLLDAAGAVFVESGVNAPVRDIAARAGVGVGTIYRHYPTRADLIVAVYRHQIDACATAGPELLALHRSPLEALSRWIDLFVDFLVTKHGLAAAMQTDRAGFTALHQYFVETLVPVCDQLLEAARSAGEIDSPPPAYELMRGIGNLCIDQDARYQPRRLVHLLVDGLHRARAAD